MRFTVLGGGGFIGRNLAVHLARSGHDAHIPNRNETSFDDADPGHIIYAIGLTGDFRKRPYETVEAHVCHLARVLKACRFSSFLYLSSARIYASLPAGSATNESTPVPVAPTSDQLYDISKLLGESLCLAHPEPTVRVARLSNVYGPGQSKSTFLGALVHELVANGHVDVDEDPLSSKDYVAIADVCPMLERIAIDGRRRLYNVASGRATKHADIAAGLSRVQGGSIAFKAGGAKRALPAIDVTRIRDEFAFHARDVLDDLGLLTSAARDELEIK